MQSFLQNRRIKHTVEAQIVAAKDSISDARLREIPTGNSSLERGASLHAPDDVCSDLSLAKHLPGVELLDDQGPDATKPRFLVTGWAYDDVENPRNFPLAKRICATLMVSALGCVVGVASSIYAGVALQNAEAYGVSEVAVSVVTGIYLLGFAAGSLVSGPLSEVLGRNVVYAASLSLFTIFVMAGALAPNFGALLAFRFLSGVFGCPPLTCAGGTIADLWDPLEKTVYFPLYAMISFIGPALGPLIASYVGQTDVLSWYWVGWLVMIMSAVVLLLIVGFQPETYAPLLLRWRAQHIRAITGDDRYTCAMESSNLCLANRIGGALRSQFHLTVLEPIVMLISLYMTVVYIVLFSFLGGYTYIFTEMHGISQGLTNIIWAAMILGILSVSVFVYPTFRKTKQLLVSAPKDTGVESGIEPEERLWYALLGAPLIPISLFWMAWTDFPHISIWSPIVASAAFGLGTICIFISSYMYVIECYQAYAASALGFMTVSRYAVAGGMTIVGIPFYRNMGVQWTLTILGCISAALVPVPFVFYRFGPTIRSWSKYTVHDRTAK